MISTLFHPSIRRTGITAIFSVCWCIAVTTPLPAATVIIADTSINHIDTLFSADTNILRGVARLDSLRVLTIQPGTVIKAMPGSGGNMSTLVIGRGAILQAFGTLDSPIVFTSTTDDLRNPWDLGAGATGLWGGIIVCGEAPVDIDTGLVSELPRTLPAAKKRFGGINLESCAARLTFLSIRHAGAANEVGLKMPSLAFCGSGFNTVVNHVEVLSGAGDGIAIRGGHVNTKFLVSAFCGEDAFDLSNGYTGEGQHWFSIQNQPTSSINGPDHALRVTGLADSSLHASPTNLTLYNATFIGPGQAAVVPTGRSNEAILFSQRAAGHLYNVITTRFPSKAICIDSVWTNDSREQLKSRDLTLMNCWFWNVGKANSWDSIVSHSYESIQLRPLDTIADPKLREPGGGAYVRYMDPRQAYDSLAMVQISMPPPDGFYDPIGWVGAFGPLGVDYWIVGWTGLDANRLCTRLIEITPVGGEIYLSGGNSKFDLNFLCKIPEGGLLDNGVVVNVDTRDVLAAYLARAWSTPLKAGGMDYRVPNVFAYELGVAGSHRISCRFTFDSGLSVGDSTVLLTR